MISFEEVNEWWEICFFSLVVDLNIKMSNQCISFVFLVIFIGPFIPYLIWLYYLILSHCRVQWLQNEWCQWHEGVIVVTDSLLIHEDRENWLSEYLTAYIPMASLMLQTSLSSNYNEYIVLLDTWEPKLCNNEILSKIKIAFFYLNVWAYCHVPKCTINHKGKIILCCKVKT